MKQLTVQMPDNQYPFFMGLLNRFDFVSYNVNTMARFDKELKRLVKKYPSLNNFA